jgi:hypothetical protein
VIAADGMSAPDDQRAPVRDPAAFETALTQARRSRDEVLATATAERLVDALGHAAHQWRVPNHPRRLKTAAAIERATGWSRGMIETGIDFVFSAVNEASLRTLVESEAGGGTAISPPARTRRRGPDVIYQALAGNVPGQGIPAIVAALLAGSVLVVRDSARQPALTSAFRATIESVDPLLARMIIPVQWRHDGESRALESAIVAAADRIELSGSDETIAALARRYASERPARFALHGSRLSVGIVPAGADPAASADGFAVDVAMYEGRGCLTPHGIYVEGDAGRADAFAEQLAQALERTETRWPRARGSTTDEVLRRRFLDEAEILALGSPGCRCLTGPRGAWCVSVIAAADTIAGPGGRCVRVVPVASLANFAARSQLPLAAIGVPGGETALDSLVRARLEGTGASIILAAGRMQAPPIHWRQDGLQRLGDLLEPHA